ncbi:MAG: prolipoprotein diacylglyceryl transferase [Clostridia bacterium]|nr:prolipoprotein diacylglyceryl transferase [Clostridia bacterium]
MASIGIALLLCKIQDGKYGIKFEDILDLSIILIPISFICARIYYVVFSLEAYNNIIDILNIKDGGLAIYGGIIGGVVTAYVFCKKRKINFLDLLDYIVPFLALGQGIGRWGNFINVEAYGIETNLPWKMGIQGTNGIQYVHPTFLYESICNLIIFVILSIISKKRKYTGQITYYYIVMYSFIRAIIENLRIDSLMLYNFRISGILSGILFVTFCIIIAKKENKCLKNKK